MTFSKKLTLTNPNTMTQEDLLKRILDKLEQIRHEANLNASTEDIASIASEVDSIRSELKDIKGLLKEILEPKD